MLYNKCHHSRSGGPISRHERIFSQPQQDCVSEFRKTVTPSKHFHKLPTSLINLGQDIAYQSPVSILLVSSCVCLLCEPVWQSSCSEKWDGNHGLPHLVTRTTSRVAVKQSPMPTSAITPRIIWDNTLILPLLQACVLLTGVIVVRGAVFCLSADVTNEMGCAVVIPAESCAED